jgi:electron transfer flavoprotein alpha subunit
MIWVVVEHAYGNLCPVTLELVAAAEHLGRLVSMDLEMVVVGASVDAPARQAAAITGKNVTAIEVAGLDEYNGGAYRSVLGRFFSPRRPAFVIAGHTCRGQDFAPGLAIRLRAANITAVEGVGGDQDRLFFRRSINGGRQMGHIAALSPCAVLTVQPGMFAFTATPGCDPGRVNTLRMAYDGDDIRVVGAVAAPAQDTPLDNARVIVCAGNGVGAPENMALIHRLAALFSKSAVAGSRIVCDRGWLPCSRQVGITGATVAPELYIACGVSGAAQHLAGMGGSAMVIAINKDPEAPMMNCADICIDEDLTRFIPALIEAWENSQANAPCPAGKTDD